MARLVLYPAIATFSFVSIYWLASLYDFALRDPRFLDGWILLSGMAAQLLFHIKDHSKLLRRLSDVKWTQIHILTGYVVLGAFAVHTSVSLPDSHLEWGLWGLFILVVVSGIIGSYLMVAIPVKLEQDTTPIEFEAIPAARLKLARNAEALSTSVEDAESLRAIWELYSTSLRDFFNGPRNVFAHLKGSSLPLKRLCHGIESCELALDNADNTTLSSLKALAIEKDRLDFRFAHQGLLRMWTFVHVPATYGLIVLTILHIAICYAFSSGVP